MSSISTLALFCNRGTRLKQNSFLQGTSNFGISLTITNNIMAVIALYHRDFIFTCIGYQLQFMIRDILTQTPALSICTKVMLLVLSSCWKIYIGICFSKLQKMVRINRALKVQISLLVLNRIQIVKNPVTPNSKEFQPLNYRSERENQNREPDKRAFLMITNQ